jgi:Cys-rich protein (TIGR01571 family)
MAYQGLSNDYPQKPQQQQYPAAPQQQQYPAGQPQYGQPVTAYAVPAMPINNWTYEFCGCTDDTNECLDTWCCHYCKVGWMFGRLETGRVEMNGLWCCGTCFADYCFCGLATLGVTYMLRSRVLMRYGIREDGCSTFMLSICCPACALCQQAREMEARRESCGGTACKSVPPDQMAPMGMMPPGGAYSQQQYTQQPYQQGGYQVQPQYLQHPQYQQQPQYRQ